MKTIVISAVNLVEAGTLNILEECLSFLASVSSKGEYRIVALVHKRTLTDYPGIEYIETQWPKKYWINRIWYEYVSMRSISKEIGPIYLWFSLHDTSPSVIAERRAVYCHNSFSFYRWKLYDLIVAPKIILFALLSKYIYLPNIHHNTYLVVQQEWFRKALQKMFSIDKSKIIVAPPRQTTINFLDSESAKDLCYTFLFAGSANSHKNFELICRAIEILHNKGLSDFKVHITVKGDENKYAAWLLKKWGHLEAINFVGFLSRESLKQYYASSNCLVYPSKIESWGLPISEFAAYHKPMLLANLPYAQETASGCAMVSFFDPDDPLELAIKMTSLIRGDLSFLKNVERKKLEPPFSLTWEETFNILLR